MFQLEQLSIGRHLWVNMPNKVMLMLIGFCLLAYPNGADAKAKKVSSWTAYCGQPNHSNKSSAEKADDQFTPSPSGDKIAYIHEVKSSDVPSGKAGSLWIGDCRTGLAHQLLSDHFSTKGQDGGWSTLSGPVFSLDGKQVFVSAGFGGDTLLVQRVDLETGKRHYVMAAELLGVVKNGPYRGGLVASQHTLIKDSKGQEYGGYPFYIFNSEGVIIKNIPGSESWDDLGIEVMVQETTLGNSVRSSMSAAATFWLPLRKRTIGGAIYLC